jgi:hypothetical protein
MMRGFLYMTRLADLYARHMRSAIFLVLSSIGVCSLNLCPDTVVAQFRIPEGYYRFRGSGVD